MKKLVEIFAVVLLLVVFAWLLNYALANDPSLQGSPAYRERMQEEIGSQSK